MEEKIRKYVEYHFRNKKGKDKESLIEEVTNNLLERYEELKEAYGDEDRAYRETIARMGDFTDEEREFNPVFTETPRLYDVGLLVGVVLSVFGLVAIFLYSSLAFILTVISIVLFVASAYYTYHQAQYEKTVNGDIDRFHLYLDKSFSYLKTAFIFWGITFTILLGQMIAATILFIEGVNNPINAITNIQDFIGLYFFSFLIASIVISVFLYKIHKGIMKYYHHISGKGSLDGTFKKGWGMLQGDYTIFDISFNNLLPWIALVLFILSLILPIRIHTGELPDGYLHSDSVPAFVMMFQLLHIRYEFIGVFPLLTSVWLAIVIIKNLRRPSGRILWFIISTLSVIIGYYLTVTLAPSDVSVSFTTALNSVVVLLVLLIIMLARLIYQVINKTQLKGQM